MKPQAILTLLLLFTLLAGCEAPTDALEDASSSVQKVEGAGKLLPPTARRALGSTRWATAKYHDVKRALAAGYVPASPHVPQMGVHYVNFGLVDGTFDPEKPEVLIYNTMPNGMPRLVAVEYMVPSHLPVPEGYDGDADVWTPLTTPGGTFWALHAWVWLPNPLGIFAPHNPRVP